MRHPAVGQVAVVGVPDERLGEVGHGVRRAAPGATVDRRRADRVVPRPRWRTTRCPAVSARRRPPPERQREGAEVRAARPGRLTPRRYRPAMPQDVPFQGVIGRTLEDSTPWWPPLPQRPRARPTSSWCCSTTSGTRSSAATARTSRRRRSTGSAADGLRYSNFHTTALCSPTRACLLTGRNHHRSGMAPHRRVRVGLPRLRRDDARRRTGSCPRSWLRNGYATFAVGKWHLAPGARDGDRAASRDALAARSRVRALLRVPRRRDRPVPPRSRARQPPGRPAAHAGARATTSPRTWSTTPSASSRTCARSAPTKPFLLWFAPGACHAPHQVPRPYIESTGARSTRAGTRGARRSSPGRWRSGLLPEGTELSERPHWIAAWDSLTDDERRLYARMMEVYAGFLEHTDAQVGRVLDFIDELGELDNTIVVVMSDNGASAEGGPRGSFNEMYFFNVEPESLEENLRRIDDLGGPDAHNHYAWGWAWAGNTPLKRWKRETHEGGVADPLIVHWPARHRAAGRDAPPVRARHRLAADVARRHRHRAARVDRGRRRSSPIDGVSFAHTLARTVPRRAATSRSTTRCSAAGRSTTTDGRRSRSTRCSCFGTTGSDPRLPVRRGPVGAVPRRRGLLRDRRPRGEGARAASPT